MRRRPGASGSALHRKREQTMYLKTEGIVLRETEYGEADRLLTVLTRDYGRMTLRARGVKRGRSPLKSACQLLAYSEFTVFDYRARATINEAVAIEQFRQLREDIELLALGSYFAQVAELLAQEDCPNPRLLSLLLNSLYILCRRSRPQPLVKAAFELKAACLAGFEPDLSGCALCGAPSPERFNVSHGVLQCAGCASPQLDGLRLPVSAGTLAAMRHIVRGDEKKLFSFSLSDEALGELSGVTETFLTTQLEHGFYTLDFYKSLFLT